MVLLLTREVNLWPFKAYTYSVGQLSRGYWGPNWLTAASVVLSLNILLVT